MGITAQFDRKEINAAVATLFGACRKHGKAPGFLAASVEHAREWGAKGARCI
jgi:2-keto-3-deoxy-L-rhamnonate aldolase RhmA